MSRSNLDRTVSRPIVLGWALWLLGSWTVNWLIDGPVRVTDIAVTPVVRWTVVMALVGLSTYWPLIRLSQRREVEERSQSDQASNRSVPDGFLLLGDAWGLMLVFQVIIWPMRFLTGWTVQQTLVIDLAVVMHAAVTMVWIMIGRRQNSGSAMRLVMMGACLATLIEPAWYFAARSDEAALGFSPMRAVWVLTDQWPFMDVRAVVMRQAAVIVAAMVAAAVLIALKNRGESAESTEC